MVELGMENGGGILLVDRDEISKFDRGGVTFTRLLDFLFPSGIVPA